MVEYTLDEKSGTTFREYWSCKLDKDGNLLTNSVGKELATPHEVGIGNRFNEYRGGWHYYGTSFLSADHALKLAAEQRQAHLREQEEVNETNQRLCHEASKLLVRR